MDSLTRRQGWVPEDELTCEATDQIKTVLPLSRRPTGGTNLSFGTKTEMNSTLCTAGQPWKQNNRM